jgi:uncharacterized protein (DUF362 family)
MGYSSLLCALPVQQGCKNNLKTPIPVSLVNNSDDAYSISRAIELVNGFDFLKPGDSVLLKLALNSSNSFPATTSPYMVSQIVTLLKEHGAGDVFVGDKSPTWQDTINCMQKTGIYQAAQDAGAELVVFNDEDMIQVQPAQAIRWPDGFSMPKIFNQVEHIIVLPTLRTHQMAGFTMGMKIFVGALPQDDRFFIHKSLQFLEVIAEIALCTDKIRLSILDARQGFNSDGPDSGNLIKPDIVVASRDLVAADAVGLAMLKSIGTTTALTSTSVWNHPTIKRGIQVHSPDLSSDTLKLKAEGVDTIADIEDQLRL